MINQIKTGIIISLLAFLLLLLTDVDCKPVAVAAKIHGKENDKYCPKTEGEKKKQLEAEERPDLHEGDMKISPKLEAMIKKMNKTGQRDFISLPSMQWPSPNIPYVFDSSLSERTKDVVKTACEDYAKYTCIRCVPRTTEPDYIRFYVGQGCWSYVGRQTGSQDLSLGSGCDYKGTVLHEMLHALGFFHEHTRLDRDNFVKINWSKIKTGMEVNFQKYAVGVAEYLNQDYDYNSIMHYPNDAFSTDGSDTITITASSSSGVKIGQRLGLSDIDIKQIKSAFKCKDDIPASTTAATTTVATTTPPPAAPSTTPGPPSPPPPLPPTAASSTSGPTTASTTQIPPLTPPPPSPAPGTTPSTPGPPAAATTAEPSTKAPVTQPAATTVSMITTPIVVSFPGPFPTLGKVVIKIKAGASPMGTYPSWPNDFQWNTNGMPQTCNCQTCNCQCVHMNEPAAGSEWKNNYLCYKKSKINPGIEWSYDGAVSNKRCTHISDPTFGNYWKNNFLCVPNNSPYNFLWSSRGPVNGKDISCLKMDVPGGPKEWTDNFLCAKKIRR